MASSSSCHHFIVYVCMEEVITLGWDCVPAPHSHVRVTLGLQDWRHVCTTTAVMTLEWDGAEEQRSPFRVTLGISVSRRLTSSSVVWYLTCIRVCRRSR